MKPILLFLFLLTALTCKASGVDSILLPVHVICFDVNKDRASEAEVLAGSVRGKYEAGKNIFLVAVPQDSAVIIEVKCPGFQTARFRFVAHGSFVVDGFITTEWLNVQLDKSECRYMLFGKNLVPLHPDSMRIGVVTADLKDFQQKLLAKLIDSLGLEPAPVIPDTTERLFNRIGQCHCPCTAYRRKNGNPFSSSDDRIRILRARGFIVGVFMNQHCFAEVYTFPLIIAPSNYTSRPSLKKTIASLGLSIIVDGNYITVAPVDKGIGIGILDLIDKLNNSGQVTYAQMETYGCVCLE